MKGLRWGNGLGEPEQMERWRRERKLYKDGGGEDDHHLGIQEQVLFRL